MVLLLSWAQDKLWLGMPGMVHGGLLMQPLWLMNSWGLCPRSGSVFSFPWASKPAGHPGQRAGDSVSGVLELMAGGRAAVLAQEN